MSWMVWYDILIRFYPSLSKPGSELKYVHADIIHDWDAKSFRYWLSIKQSGTIIRLYDRRHKLIRSRFALVVFLRSHKIRVMLLILSIVSCSLAHDHHNKLHHTTSASRTLFRRTCHLIVINWQTRVLLRWYQNITVNNGSIGWYQ